MCYTVGQPLPRACTLAVQPSFTIQKGFSLVNSGSLNSKDHTITRLYIYIYIWRRASVMFRTDLQ